MKRKKVSDDDDNLYFIRKWTTIVFRYFRMKITNSTNIIKFK